MADEIGALSRRRLLGAGAAVGATALAGVAPAGPTGSAPAAASVRDPDARPGVGRQPNPASIPGISLMAGNELDVGHEHRVREGSVQRLLPERHQRLRGHLARRPRRQHRAATSCSSSTSSPTAPAALRRAAVPPGRRSPAVEVLLSHTATGGHGRDHRSTAAAVLHSLPRLIGPSDSLCAFVWRGQRTCVCRGIRVDYIPPGVESSGRRAVSIVPIPPARGVRLPPGRRQAARRRGAHDLAGHGHDRYAVVPARRDRRPPSPSR